MSMEYFYKDRDKISNISSFGEDDWQTERREKTNFYFFVFLWSLLDFVPIKKYIYSLKFPPIIHLQFFLVNINICMCIYECIYILNLYSLENKCTIGGSAETFLFV